MTFDDKPEAIAEVKGLPVPNKLGTYALVLERGGKRQFLASVARVIKPRANANLESTPIMGEGQMFDRRELLPQRVAAFARMGVRGVRHETSWNERQDGQVDWSNLDALFKACEDNKVQLMITLGGHLGWTWPFGPNFQTPAVVGPKWDGNPYWGQADWLCDPKLYPRYGTWITSFCQRYWKDGKGALWGLENYNEPWEGGGISGWARDCLEYRKVQKLIAQSAWKVDRRIKLCGTSSIMNTEDKFYSDGSKEFDEYVDVLTDHYVVPAMCYGPLVATAHGKESMETETWFVNSEYLLPHAAQFLACGQRRLAPWHPRVLFDRVPGNDDQYLIPTAAFNHFVSGKRFEKIVFRDHLPWFFQFGKDDDPEGLLIVFGQLMGLGGNDPRERLWAQVEGSAGGTLVLSNADGLLQIHDLAGNRLLDGQKDVTLPLSILPTYIRCANGPAAAAVRIKEGRMAGKRPVEILPRDFSTRIDDRTAALTVTVHNCLNRAIIGKLTVAPPKEVELMANELKVALAVGESKTLTFAVRAGKPNLANAYLFSFNFTSDAGNASYQEVLNVAICPKKTITIDGDLDDWKDVPGVTVAAGIQKAEITELLRRPWLELKEKYPDGNLMEFKLAWDDKFLYAMARVNDKTAQMDAPSFADRSEDDFFHTKASDERSPYKEFLKKFPGRSFAEVPYVYARRPEEYMPFRRDRLHLALDVSDDWHDLQPTTDRVPLGFHAVPDTDYEYALYPVKGGKSELWRHLAPGVPRIHDFPRQPHGKTTTGIVAGAKHVVKRQGNTYLYELAIPREELAKLELKAGTTFGLMVPRRQQ